MQSYRHSKRANSLLDNLLANSTMPPGGDSANEIRDLKPHEEAALIITFAINGQDIQEESLDWKIRACYRLRRKYQNVYRLAAWSILIIHVFSRPLWTLREEGNVDWDNPEVYPSYGLPFMPVLASNLLLGLATLILWVSNLLEFGYHGRSHNRYFSIFFAIVLTLISLGIIMALIYYSAGKVPTFSASPLYSLPILLVERRWDNYTTSLLRLIPRMAMLLLMIATTICIFSTTALLILPHSSEEIAEYFGNYGNTVWNMLLMLNASNWPTPFMPAFDSNRAYAVFFFVFIMIADWCVLNMVLGFICMYFNAEQEFVANQEKDIFDKLHLRAFNLLDEENNGSLSYSQVDVVLKELYEFYESTLRSPSEDERYDLILLLDPHNDGFVTFENFLFLHTRCLSEALRLLRAKKEKVSRFINASVDHGNLAETYLTDVTRLSVDQSLMQLSGAQPPLVNVGKDMPTYGDSDRSSRTQSTEHTQQLQAVMDASVYGKLDARIVDRIRQQRVSSAVSTTNPLSIEIEKGLAMASENDRATTQKNSSYIIDSTWLSKIKEWVTPVKPFHDKESRPRFHQAMSTWAYTLLFIDSFYFDITIDTIIDMIGVIALSGVDCTESFIAYTVFICFEMACKLYVKGIYRYVRSKRNSIDGLMTVVFTILIIAQAVATKKDHEKRFCENYGAHILLLLRIFQWPRNIFALKSYAAFRQKHRLAFQYAFKSLDQLLFLSVVMVVYLYGYAAFVQQIYGGVITKAGEKGNAIALSSYGENGYWPFNYNDIPSGLVTTFVLLHVSNMHVITEGYEAGKQNNQWPEALFAFSYIFGVLFLLNVLVAFIINQFVKYLDGLRRQRTRKRRLAAVADGQIAKRRPVLTPVTNFDFAVENPMVQKEKHQQEDMTANDVDESNDAGEEDEVASNLSEISEGDAKFRDSLSNAHNLDASHGTTNKSLLAALTNLSLKQEAIDLGVSLPDETILVPSRQHLSDKTIASQLTIHPPTIQEEIDGKEENEDEESEEDESNENIKNIISIKAAASGKKGSSKNHSEKSTRGNKSDKSLSFPNGDSAIDDKGEERKTILDIVDLHNCTMHLDDEQSIVVTLTIQQLEELHHLEKLERSNMENNIETNVLLDSMTSTDTTTPITWWERLLLGQKLIISPLEQAKILLHFAKDGAEKYFVPNTAGYICCIVRRRFGWIFQIAAVAFAVLRFFSRPYWSYTANAEVNWNNTDIYPHSGMPMMSTRAEAGVKIPLLIVIMIGLIVEIGYKEDLFSPKFSFLKLSKSRWMRFILVFYAFISLLLLISALVSADFGTSYAKQRLVCATSIGSIMYVLWFQKMSLLKLRVFLNILPRLSVFFGTFVIIILIFASFGPMLMDDRTYANTTSGSHDDDTYFNTFTNSVWSIFAAIAASSYPQQFIPIYQEYRDTALYFISFISVGAFGMLNLILVLVFVEFQRSSKLLWRQIRASRRDLLTNIFNLLVDAERRARPKGSAKQNEFERPYVDRRVVVQLLGSLRKKYSDFERFGISRDFAQSLLVDIIDVDGDGHIGLDEFIYLVDIARVKLHVEKFSLELYLPVDSSNLAAREREHQDGNHADKANDVPDDRSFVDDKNDMMSEIYEEEVRLSTMTGGRMSVMGSMQHTYPHHGALSHHHHHPNGAISLPPIGANRTTAVAASMHTTVNRPTMVIGEEDRASLFDLIHILPHSPMAPSANNAISVNQTGGTGTGEDMRPSYFGKSPLPSPRLSFFPPSAPSFSTPTKASTPVENPSPIITPPVDYEIIPESSWKQIRIELAAHRSMFELVLDIVFDLLVIFCTILSLSLSAHRLYEYAPSECVLLFLIAFLRLMQVGYNVYLYGPKKAFHTFRNVSDFFLGVLLFCLMVGDVSAEKDADVSGWVIAARCVNMVQLVLTMRVSRSMLNAWYRSKLQFLNTYHETHQHNKANLRMDNALYLVIMQELRVLRYYQLLLLRFGRLFRRSLGRLRTLGSIFICTGYCFAVLGMLCFGGVISYTREDPDFLNSTYVANAFYNWNFNDFTSACLLLGCCLHVSDFDVIASGFTSTTNSGAAKLYFLSWYFIGVLLLLNVIKAFFLSEFVIVFSATEATNGPKRNSTSEKKQ